MAINEDNRPYTHPLYDYVGRFPGADILLSTADKVLSWGAENALWAFPMATSCCGIEFMAAAASRFDLDRIGTIARGTPRQCDVMVVAGTITVKMAPRVKKLWDQMPEPKWAIAMGSCAISGDFYRDIYSVVPGVDTFMPVDVYVPGCPPNPDQLMQGFRHLQDKIRQVRAGTWTQEENRIESSQLLGAEIGRLDDPHRDPAISEAQLYATMSLDPHGSAMRPGTRDGMPMPAPPPEPEPDPEAEGEE
jgi:NADH-quinone oxidoreductase subunit B